MNCPSASWISACEASSFLWGGFRLKRFIPVGEFDIRGLRNRYRQAGIGAPLAAEVEPTESATDTDRNRISPRPPRCR